MLKSITMTKSETEIYDNGGSKAEQLMSELRDRAAAKCDSGDMCEIYTADGMVADYVEA